jgi:hypothetical protein
MPNLSGYSPGELCPELAKPDQSCLDLVGHVLVWVSWGCAVTVISNSIGRADDIVRDYRMAMFNPTAIFIETHLVSSIFNEPSC